MVEVRAKSAWTTCWNLLTYLLTYSMVQSPSWEANWFVASQEISRILWNPKVHYRTHKRLPRVPILGQPNPVHIPTSHLLEIHPNIIHPSTPRSPQWSLSLPSHSSRFYTLYSYPQYLQVVPPPPCAGRRKTLAELVHSPKIRRTWRSYERSNVERHWTTRSVIPGLRSSYNRYVTLQSFMLLSPRYCHLMGALWTPEIRNFLEN